MIYSHNDPKQLLAEHLNGVIEWGTFFAKCSHCNMLEEIPNWLLKDMLGLHDIGKATKHFQQHLDPGCDGSELSNHSEFSAIFFLAYELYKGIEDKHKNVIFSMFYSIWRHHGDLKNIRDVYEYGTGEIRQTLLKQWNSIDQTELLLILTQCGITEIEGFLKVPYESHLNKVDDFLKASRFQNRKKNRNADETDYFLTQILYSLLVDADKSQVAIRQQELVARKEFSADVSTFLAKKNPADTNLNRMRGAALAEVLKNISIRDYLMTLTLPTGLGKTLTSFQAAVRLREMLKAETGKIYRIIYVMPFMSIIDQNADVFEELLSEQNDVVMQNILLKHHHLAELSWKTDQEKHLKTHNAKMLIEGWNSEVVVTTFHQFFLTLIGYKNAMQRKFNKLSNAIVIIDEIQAIPVKYYKLIGTVLEWYTKKMDSRVIGMTATQPYIFSHEGSRELCDSKKYYQKLSRTVFINHSQRRLTVEQFAAELECEPEKTYLIIVNTINCGLELCKLLRKKYSDEEMLFLSTLMTPNKRRKKIKKIKEKQYRIVVSTQLVEAGVDISFDVVYRDMAPLPFIFQSAGRSNREGDENRPGSVYLITLVKGGRRYCDQVYRNAVVDLSLTEKVLKKEQYLEAEFIEVIDEYFKLISSEEIKSQAESDDLLNGIKRQLYDGDQDLLSNIKPVSAFKLIEDDFAKHTIFIEEDETAQQLWKQYCELSQLKADDWEQKAELKDVMRKMSDYMINVSDSVFNKYNKPPYDDNGLFRYVARNELSRYYDEEKGYGVL